MGSATFDFDDETVIVTGASSGIGRQIALGFGEAGAMVLIADVREKPRDRDADRPTHEVIERRGGTAAFVETDVSDPEQVQDIVTAARDYGGVDVMVNNAGVYEQGLMKEVTPEQLDRIYGVNVRGTYVGCQAAAEDMLDRDAPGVILNTASISSFVAQREQSAYDMTKAAVEMITKNAALEFAESDIRVNAIAPGKVATEFGSEDKRETKRAVSEDEVAKSVPFGRAADPKEMAGPALFLATDEAGYVSGETLVVDGGYLTY